MTKEQLQVKEWMIKAGQECPNKAIYPHISVELLRVSLIQEELDELSEGRSLVSMADALGDLMYVVIGTAVAYGLDLEPIFQEVHRSNMSKFIDGYKRADGKWIKGPSYSPVNLKPIIKKQMISTSTT